MNTEFYDAEPITEYTEEKVQKMLSESYSLLKEKYEKLKWSYNLASQTNEWLKDQLTLQAEQIKELEDKSLMKDGYKQYITVSKFNHQKALTAEFIQKYNHSNSELITLKLKLKKLTGGK